MKKESNHQQQFPTFCILPGLQTQFSATGIFFQDSLHIVGSMLYFLVKEAKINLARKNTGQRHQILNFFTAALIILGKYLCLLHPSFPTWEVRKTILILYISNFYGSRVFDMRCEARPLVLLNRHSTPKVQSLSFYPFRYID